MLREVYAAAIAGGHPVIVTDLATAELVKVAANSFLATKISFINAMAEICEAAGRRRRPCSPTRSATTPASAAASSTPASASAAAACPRTSGPSWPAPASSAPTRRSTFLREVDEINMRRRTRIVDLARDGLGGSVRRRRDVAVLGAAFKPDSDDVRDSPALNVAAQLQLQGAEVVVTDPEAHRQRAPAVPRAAATPRRTQEACEGADVVLHLTEWPEYSALDPARSARSCGSGTCSTAATRSTPPLAGRGLELPRARPPTRLTPGAAA